MNSLNQKRLREDRRVWSEQEDKLLQELVKVHGYGAWAEVARKLTSQFPQITRSGKQCRERYCNHLDPEIVRTEFSPAQQDSFATLWLEYGNKWTKIAELMKGRTESSLKNYFYSNMRRAVKVVNQKIQLNNSAFSMETFSNIFDQFPKATKIQLKQFISCLFQLGKRSRASPSPQGLQTLIKNIALVIRRMREQPIKIEQNEVWLKETGKSLNQKQSEENSKNSKEEIISIWEIQEMEQNILDNELGIYIRETDLYSPVFD